MSFSIDQIFPSLAKSNAGGETGRSLSLKTIGEDAQSILNAAANRAISDLKSQAINALGGTREGQAVQREIVTTKVRMALANPLFWVIGAVLGLLLWRGLKKS